MFTSMGNLLAQTALTIAPTGNFAPLTTITIPGILSALVIGVLVIAAILFFFMLVIGGIRWITSGGDKGGTEAARNQITAALIGLVIVFAAWAIISLVGTLFGISVLAGLSIPSFQ